MVVSLTIEYDGTNYCGWQIQPGLPTIQSELEAALEKVSGKHLDIVGSGRTDSGVHAKGQVASFETDSGMDPERYSYALNTFLPEDIRVLKSRREEDGFNARFSAKKKTYMYSMYVDRISHPLEDRYSLQLINNLNVQEMQKAAERFKGTHDFACFLSSNSSVVSTVRTIYESRIEADGNKIRYIVTGNGFLYNMVRIMVGTLIDVGEGKKKPEDMDEIMSGKDRGLAGHTVKAKGLTLMSVEYE